MDRLKACSYLQGEPRDKVINIAWTVVDVNKVPIIEGYGVVSLLEEKYGLVEGPSYTGKECTAQVIVHMIAGMRPNQMNDHSEGRAHAAKRLNRRQSRLLGGIVASITDQRLFDERFRTG